MVARPERLHVMNEEFLPGTMGSAGNYSRRAFLGRVGTLTAAAISTQLARVSADEPPAQFVEKPCNLVLLPCGRRLAYAEFGDPKATQTILLFHGVPSCRLEGVAHLTALRQQPGVRLLGVDRPGFGLSDPAADIRFAAWSNDIAALADALDIKQFSLMAFSGGAPYALAVAHAMPERVKAVALGCPMAPVEAADTTGSGGASGAWFAEQHPVLARVALNHFINGMRRNPRRIPFSRFMGASERRFLANPEIHNLFVQITCEACRQGPAEVCRGGAVLVQPWARWLGNVKQKVAIFQGCSDEVVTPNMARYLAAALPNAELNLFEGDGHMSVGWHRSAEIVKAALG